MATSKIKIYKTHLIPARNALVDGIEYYLGNLTPTYSNDAFQYQKLGLDIIVKIVAPQSVIANQSLGNYVRIEQDGKIWYYFITNTEWTSVDTVKLHLSIDSINTFRDDFHLSEKTSIIRQHGDRFYDTNSSTLVRRIDVESENIVSEKENISAEKIVENNFDFDWYLMYRTRNNLSTTDIANPIDCFCFASEPLTIKQASGETKTFTVDNFINKNYYYFTDIDNPGGQLKVGDTTYTLGTLMEVPKAAKFNPANVWERTWTLSAILKMVEIYRNDNKLEITFYSVGTDGQPFIYSYAYTAVDSQAFAAASVVAAIVPSVVFTIGNFFRYSSSRYFVDGSYGVVAQVKQKLNINAGVAGQTTNTIDDIDKTDSRILKIIKLPYCPLEITYSGGTYIFPDGWVYDAGLMKLSDANLSTQFENKIGSITLPELFLTESAANRSVLVAKDISRESKLYHSDFYTKKLVYDNFTRDIPLEQIDLSGRTYPNITVNLSNLPLYFKPTNTINSKFAFKIDYNTLNTNFGKYKPLSDYDNFILVSRNNEETIFSNDFINYIRTGYNYDKKAKEMQESRSRFSAGLQLAAGVASFAATSITGGVSAAAGISLVSSAINTFTSAANTAKTNENSMQAKLAQLAAQSSNVSGSDDVDLLSYYNGNRLALFEYDTKEHQKNAAYNLMYYCGYSHTIIGLPNTTSRYWFNFIQCSPVFKEEGISPYNDYLNDIKSRYQAGITVYHKHNGINGDGYDWEQELENWETFLAISPTPDITVMAGSTTYHIGFKAIEPLGEWVDNGTTIYYELEITDDNDNTGTVRTTTAGQRDVVVQMSDYQGIKQIKIREVNGAQTTAWYTQTF